MVKKSEFMIYIWGDQIHDGRIDVNFDQYRMKSGDSTKIYLVCNKIVSGTKKCDFSIRKDLSPK